MGRLARSRARTTEAASLSAAQAGTAQTALLITGTQVAMGLPFGVFGGVVNAFQRYDINNAVSIGTSITVAPVNVTMLFLGYGLVAVVFATHAGAARVHSHLSAQRLSSGSAAVRPPVFLSHGAVAGSQRLQCLRSGHRTGLVPGLCRMGAGSRRRRGHRRGDRARLGRRSGTQEVFLVSPRAAGQRTQKTLLSSCDPSRSP